LQDTAREIFLAKQANERKEKWVMGNYIFFRMHRITDIYFVGGFGTVQWIDVNEYLTATPDAIATNSPAVTLQVGWCSAVSAGHTGLCGNRWL
jgi:nitrate reductase NapE component